MTLRLIAVHAHPDDESSKGAATYAHYLELGYEVLIVSCTGGERGDILNAAIAKDPAAHRDLAGLRRQEMARARDVIGFRHLWLGYQDSGLPSEGEEVHPYSFAGLPAELTAEALVRVVRRFKPHVMITYNEIGGYPHPDHIRCHEISRIAWETAGDAAAYPEAGAPWEIKKLYYEEIFNAERVRVMHDWAMQTQPDTPLAEQLTWLNERMSERPYNGTTRVNVSRFFEQRDTALRAHASQVEPDNSFFFLPNDMQRELWPFEDYRLAASRVHDPAADAVTRAFADANTDVATVETDLFTGITEEATPAMPGVTS